MVILNELRSGEFDVLVGVNLLREGLDLPEVSLVCILDADKEGFLRSGTSLIQQMGRAARNVNARVVMYADKMTPAMQEAIDETERRRAKQLAYNAEHGITPKTIIKAIRAGLETELKARKTAREAVRDSEPEYEIGELTRMLEAEMLEAAQSMEFEKAAAIRDQVKSLKQRFPAPGPDEPEAQARASPATPKKIRRSELEEVLTKKPSQRPGAPGVRANKKSKRSGGRRFD